MEQITEVGSHPAEILRSVCPSAAAVCLLEVSKRKEWIQREPCF